jgi:DNA invertase Pin-like site-specific DNA recombinase
MLNPMRVIGYARVSTGVQVAKGVSLPDQEKGIRAWCRANGHTLVTIHCDKGISGGRDETEREALATALADIRDGRAVALVAKDLTRLARSLTVQEATLGMLWRLGGRFFCYENGEVLADDPDDPTRIALRQMMGVFAELERRMTAKRLRDGRRAKHERGGFAFGSPQFGRRAEGGELVIDDREQAAVERIAQLHQAGASLRQIAATLETEGHKPKRSTRWHPQSLARVVARLEPSP